MTDATIGDFLIVHLSDGGIIYADLDQEGRLDAARTRYLERGGMFDELFHLNTYSGVVFTSPISTFQSWVVSTSEGRARERWITRTLDAEGDDQPWEGAGNDNLY